MTIKDYSSTAASNTAINGVSIAGTAPVSNMDDGLRNLMADISNWTDSDTLASGTTTDLGSVQGMYVTVSGTATITGFGTLKAGMVKFVYFSGAGQITHNATSMILPRGANIGREAGDTAVFVSEGSGNWRCLQYMQAAPVAMGTRRRNLNGNFNINQRVKSGTVTLSAGAYGHDLWKAGSGGCTYTFAESGGVTTLTISAGTLVQKIEGKNLQTGTYVLSWTGTATGKIGAGSLSASGVTGSITGGADTNIEFSTGTLSLVQLEPGSTATAFEHRPFEDELRACQRFYQKTYAYNVTPGNSPNNEGVLATRRAVASETATVFGGLRPVEMVSAPTDTFYSPSTGTVDRVYDVIAGVNVALTGVSSVVPSSTRAIGAPTHSGSGAAGSTIVAHVVSEVAW